MALSGNYQINANGFKGILTLDLQEDDTIVGTTNIDPGGIDLLQNITWDEGTGKITFDRVLRGGGGIQSYTGYRYRSSNPLFSDVPQQPGGEPPGTQHFLVFNGTFQTPAGGFGWMARMRDNSPG